MRANRRHYLQTLAALAVAASVPRDAHAATPQECVQSAERSQDLRAEGKLVEARTEAMKCADNSCPQAVRADCTQWLEDWSRALPTVTFRVKAGGTSLTDVVVELDGKRLTDKLGGTAYPMDPGTHKLTVRAPGYDPHESTFLVNEGEKAHSEEVVLDKRLDANPNPKPLVPPAATSDTPQTSSMRYASYGVAGAGIVTLGVFTVLEISAQSSYSDFKAQPCAASATCDATEADRVHGKFVTALVVGGLGAAALGTGIVLFALSGSSASDSKPQPVSFTATPLVNGGGYAALGGRF